jgi:hypothetical protein
MTELPSIPAVLPWPAGSSGYPLSIDAFVAKDSGDLAKDINDITAAIKAIEDTLGTNPMGTHPSVKAALAGLHTTLSTLQTSQGQLASQVAALESIPGPANTFFNFTQLTPSATWTITHSLGRYPAITVVDSAGTVVEGEIDYVSDSQVIVTFSAAFSGQASLS